MRRRAICRRSRWPPRPPQIMLASASCCELWRLRSRTRHRYGFMGLCTGWRHRKTMFPPVVPVTWPVACLSHPTRTNILLNFHHFSCDVQVSTQLIAASTNASATNRNVASQKQLMEQVCSGSVRTMWMSEVVRRGCKSFMYTKSRLYPSLAGQAHGRLPGASGGHVQDVCRQPLQPAVSARPHQRVQGYHSARQQAGCLSQGGDLLHVMGVGISVQRAPADCACVQPRIFSVINVFWGSMRTFRARTGFCLYDAQCINSSLFVDLSLPGLLYTL